MNYKWYLKKGLVNLPGWRTRRKILVIESDDWGMIRMASKKAYKYFYQNGYAVDQCAFNKFDTLESNEDLELLFEVLYSIKDKNGNPAIFTINNIVANPDFEKIEHSNFEQYFYEPFTKTLQRYPKRDRVMELYNEGKASKIIQPQFHGREHINVNRWMSELSSGNKILRDAFEFKMFTVNKHGNTGCRKDFLDTFGVFSCKERESFSDIISSGIKLFEKIWGFKPNSFIAPCFIWPSHLESILFHNGVKLIQGTHVQRLPSEDSKNKIKRRYHYHGQTNNLGQIYFVRNVTFEPATDKSVDWVSRAMKEISIAFRFNKPAIISSHRLNYVGSIDQKNRATNLKKLKILLKNIIKEWPEVEFMSSDSLGNVMDTQNI